MSWGGLNPALTSWRGGINDRFPRRGTASDGARADKVHLSTSEHQEDADGTVDAFDMDVNLLGSSNPAGTEEERALLEALKLDFESDAAGRGQLWINRMEIANRDIGAWRERPYEGKSAHVEHCHWQSRQSRERDGRPWRFTHTDALLRRLNGDDMEPKDLLDFDDVPSVYNDAATNPKVTVRTALKAAVQADVTTRDTAAAVSAVRAELKRQGDVLDAILARLPEPAAG